MSGRSTRTRWLALLLAGITAGSLLGGPAVAHVGKRMRHLITHLDPLYLNETQTAADADKLDNIDSAAFLQGASTLAGTASCPGAGFYPDDSTDNWVTNSTGRREGSPGAYRCAIDLPDGATVTAVRFTLSDANAGGDVTNCTLTRTDLSVPIAEEDAVSNPTGSTGTGDQTLSGTIIAANAVIDNAGRGYSLECTLASDTGIYGASVTYTVPASAG